MKSSRFAKKQLEDPIQEFGAIKDLDKLDDKKRIIIGYFDRRDQAEYNIFRRVATNLKEDCQFHVGFGDVVAQMHPPGTPIVAFRPDTALSHDNDETYQGSYTNLEELNKWVLQKCVPLVREITFENAEEFTEEGLPFLIFFYRPGDTESIKDYKAVVENELLTEKCKLKYEKKTSNLSRATTRNLGRTERWWLKGSRLESYSGLVMGR